MRLLRDVLPALLCLAPLTACTAATDLGCDPATVGTLTIGVQVKDALDTGHCISEGDPGDLYQFSLGGTSVVRFIAQSDKFPPEISIAKPSSSPSNDDQVGFVAGNPARTVLVLPAGQYVLDVQSSDNAVGAYTLSSDNVSMNTCYSATGAMVFIATGTTFSSTLEATDCTGPAEIMGVYLRGGRSYTFTATSGIAQYNMRLGPMSGGAAVRGDGVITTNGTATFSYTPPSSGYYSIAVGAVGGRTGAYTLTITP